eukprot:m.364750 g.364750  ORF g.364750 m.364750 type:complete len:52 (+) comp56042_c0_seq24:792-947(+)
MSDLVLVVSVGDAPSRLCGWEMNSGFEKKEFIPSHSAGTDSCRLTKFVANG